MHKLFVGLTASALLLNSLPAQAVPPPTASGKWYNLRRMDRGQSRDITNVDAILTGGWNNLAAPAPDPAANYGPQINKGMWLAFEDVGERPCYVEIQNIANNLTPAQAAASQANGVAYAISPSYKGHVVSTTLSANNGNQVVASFLSGGNGTGTAQTGGTYDISKVGAAWKASINGAVVYTVPLKCAKANYTTYVPNYGSYADVGIESNDTGNTYTNNTSATVRYKSVFGGSAWAPWANTQQRLINTSGWYQSYNTTTGKVTLSK